MSPHPLAWECRITSIGPAPIVLAYSNASWRENITADMIGTYCEQTETHQWRDTAIGNRSLAALVPANNCPPFATILNECFNLV